jgi:transposase
MNMKKNYVGIDVSKKTLDVRIYNSDNFSSENHHVFNNEFQGFHSLLRWLKSKKLSIGETAFCLEHTGIYSLALCAFFDEHSVDYVVVSGLELKCSLGISRGKSDNIDAGRIARYLYLRRDELVYSKSKSAVLLRIQSLMAERRSYVKRSAQAKAYLTEHKEHSATTSYVRYTSEHKHVESLIKDVEMEILLVIEEHSELSNNYSLLLSIPGISFVNAVNTILYTNNFTSFSNSRAYACYCGVAPFGYQSGTSLKSSPRVSKMANKMLKSDLSQAALSSLTHDPEMRLYYQRKLLEGKHFGVINNAIKFKLIERMFSVVKRGTPYVKLAKHAS